VPCGMRSFWERCWGHQSDLLEESPRQRAKRWEATEACYRAARIVFSSEPVRHEELRRSIALINRFLEALGIQLSARGDDANKH